jgi:protoheme IX farnesyltransferase
MMTGLQGSTSTLASRSERTKFKSTLQSNSVSVVLMRRLAAYWELTKPGITRLVLISTAAGFYLASAGFDWVLFLHTLVGTGLAASGTNALNQWAERDADARMRRTARRPLPSGRLGSMEALAFSAGIAIAGLAYLLAFVNVLSASIVALSLTSYVFVYTPLKRITWMSTLIGAVPGALPVVAGWTATGHPIGAVAVTLFLILFVWQMPHFFALAWIYREDYARGGFRMLTVVDPTGVRAARQAAAYTLVLMALSLLPFFGSVASPVYFVGAALLGSVFVTLSLLQLRARTDRAAWRLFFGSVVYLPLLLFLLMVDKAV